MRDFADPFMDEKVVEPRDKDTMSLSACLNRIMLKVQNESFCEEAVEELKADFDYVGQKMGICPEEAAILACVLENSHGYHSCDGEEIAKFMGFTNIEFLGYRKFLDSLAVKRVVRSTRTRGGVAYVILKEAAQAIIDDKEFSEKNFSGLTTEEVFTQMRKAFRAFRDDELTHCMLIQDLNMLVDVNQQNVFCERIIDCGLRKLPQTEQRIFYYLCHRYVSFGEKCVDFGVISDMIPEDEDSQKFFRAFQAGKLPLQKSGLITFGGEGGLMDKNTASLSDKVRETFFTEVGLFAEEHMEGHKDLVGSESIVAKELYYNAHEQEQVERLGNLLKEENFKGVQSRLEEMGLRKGFNVILYGGPGTGKTETTMQIARKTGRDVFFVDMSSLKSKWVGESEKIVKGIFNTYRVLCKIKERKPILLFNEADAIFSKRMENVESSAAQMLNSLQNIILQEMEQMDGVMFCTTNLHTNMDPAFERRFLYKIELEKPGEEVRAKIWKSMLKGLGDDDYAVLARRYPFSGGQIENVVRKSTVEYIISGQRTSLENVCRFCDEENFRSKVCKVGF